MLNSMRKSTQSLPAKILLVIVAGSFAIWGAGDVFRSRGDNVVATVGDSTLTRAQYQAALQDQMERFSQYLQGAEAEALMRQLGLDRHVLEQLIGDLLLDEKIDDGHIIVTDDAVKVLIASIPAFQTDGRFDPAKFRELLARQRTSEAAFLENLRFNMARDRLLGAMVSINSVPAPLLDTLHTWREETRDVDVVRVPVSLIPEPGAPSDTELSQYYERHRQEYALPEYRSITYVRFGSEEVRDRVDVAEEEIRDRYEEAKDSYIAPPTRDITQLRFDSEEAARAGAEALQAGRTMKELAEDSDAEYFEQQGVKVTDLPEDQAETVFGLEKGGISQPLQSEFGWHVFRVDDMRSGGQQTFEDVRPAIEAAIRSERSAEALEALGREIEDMLGAGKTLAEAAREAGLEPHEEGPFNKQGMGLTGNPIAEELLWDGWLDTAFALSQGEVSPVIPLSGMSVMVEVTEVQPARMRTLDEVRGLAISGWQAEKRREQLLAKASELAAKLKQDEADRAALLAEYQAEATKIEDLPRNGSNDILPLPQSLVAALFNAPEGKYTEAFAAQGTDEAYIGHVTAINAPSAQADGEGNAPKQEMVDSLRLQLGSDIQAQYMAWLRRQIPVNVNMAAIGPASSEDGGEVQ